MRQNNKNNRGRGRGGRKGPNPLTRSYESNGPDVKVRGTAQHVADKYMSLARDALSSGDGVAAENYFQHAEHYNRIIMTAQAQQNAQREERANAAAEASEQPSISEGENQQPTIRTGDEPQPSIHVADENPAADGATISTEGAADGKEMPPKTRRRRSPPKPRRSADEKPQPDVAAAPVVAETSDTIADNPPAFLLND